MFWGDCLNTLRRGSDSDAINGVYQVLKTRVSNLSGGVMREVQFKDAMRLYARNASVDSHNNPQLQNLVKAGAERLRLIAVHGQVGDAGQVSLELIAVGQIPKDRDNCGGLADVVEVNRTVTRSCLPRQCSCEMAITTLVQVATGVRVLLDVTCDSIMSLACLNRIKICWGMTC